MEGQHGNTNKMTLLLKNINKGSKIERKKKKKKKNEREQEIRNQPKLKIEY